MDDDLTLRYVALSRTHFWLTSKACVIEDFLLPELTREGRLDRVLEVGCCAGGFLEKLAGVAEELHGLDLSLGALRRCRTERPAIRAANASGDRLPYGDATFDALLMQDVLEHIPDDAGALREVGRVLRPGGLCFVCVPAYMALYGHHDRLYGHLRRYGRRELTDTLRNAGFRIVRATYFQSPFLVPLYVKRRFGRSEGDDFVAPPAPVNAFLDWFLRLERWPMRFLDLPFGPTLMTLARKA